jgi:hypothetical protein
MNPNPVLFFLSETPQKGSNLRKKYLKKKKKVARTHVSYLLELFVSLTKSHLEVGQAIPM